MDRIQKTIATVGVQLIVAFCAGLVAHDASAQQSEAERVIHIRSRPLGEWIQDLQSDNATKRYVAAVRVLPTAREHAAVIVPRLIEILEDPRVDVRCTAARALAGFNEAAREAVPALERSLDDHRLIVQLHAARALYQIDGRSEPGVRLSVQGLDSEDEHARRFSHTLIREMGSDAAETVPALLQQLQRQNLDTQRAVLKDLAAIGPQALDAIPRLIDLLSDKQLDGPAFNAIESIGSVSLPALLGSIEHSSSLHRKNTCRLMVRIAPRDPKTAPAVIQLLDDPDPQVRLAAARGIERMNVDSPAIVKSLRQATRDPVKSVASAAVKSLSSQGAAAVPILRKLISEGDPPLRLQAIGSLSELGKIAAPATPELMLRLKEGEKTEQIAVLRCLRHVVDSPDDVIPIVHGIVKARIDSPPNDALLREAVTTLTAYKASIVIPDLVALLEAERTGKRNYVKSGSPEALGLIAPAMRTDGARGYVDSRDMELNWLIGAVGSFGKESHEALPALKRIRDDPAALPLNRRSAANAIAAIE